MKPFLADLKSAFGETESDGKREQYLIYYLPCLREQNFSLDTLKKLSKTLEKGKKNASLCFWQALPLRCLASPRHLEWSVFQVVSDWKNQAMHFRQPELELLGRISGHFQWERARSQAGLKDSDKEVVLVGVGPPSLVNSKTFSLLAKEWGLKPLPFSAWKRSPENEITSIETSALAGLQ